MEFSFDSFLDGSFDLDRQTGAHTCLWLREEKAEIGAGRLTKHDIDRLRDFPELSVVTVSGLRQDTFEYLIHTYGAQLRAIRFFKNKYVEDWSLLGTLPQLEYIDFYGNQRITGLWDMTGNTALSGLSIMDFTRLTSLEGIAKAPALKQLRVGNVNPLRARMILESLSPLAGSGIETLCFCGKDLIDRDLSFLAGMPHLKVFDFPANLYGTEEVAWIAANFPFLTGYAIKPYLDFTEKNLEGDETRKVVGMRKPKLPFPGNEERLRRYAEAFETLTERYKGVSYADAFKKKRQTRRRITLARRKKRAAKQTKRKIGRKTKRLLKESKNQ